MDKNAIKKYAVWARNELIARVSQRAQRYGITKDQIVDANADSVNGIILTDTEKKQRQALIQKIRDKEFEQVMEEVAYTWFNRFSALRFMEVNGYLPSHVRVFTDQNNAFKPEIMSEAIHLNLEGLDMEKVYALKEANNDDELFKYLIITQCNDLSNILPGMFQKIADYTELLFPDNLLREGSVIEQMITLIPEEDWKDQVQIIGWLYQYYNIEPKAEIFSRHKGTKITKYEIPAATQLFTPDWIVHYMVQNSLGRLWLEGHPNDELKNNWRYFIDDAEQDEDVKEKLFAIDKKYSDIKPEDIRVIDPCQGSGHILSVIFDTLIQIYEAYGHSARESVVSIINNNIWGLDIDERASQLAYFSIMMKARQYDRRFFVHGVQPNIYSIHESNDIDPNCLEFFTDGRADLRQSINNLIEQMEDAKEYGSILKVKGVDFKLLYSRFEEIRKESTPSLYSYQTIDTLLPFVKAAELLSMQYDVVITNPPYLAVSTCDARLYKYVNKHYKDCKTDLFAVFMDRCRDMTKKFGFQSMITMHAWMFLSSYEKFRENINCIDIVNMIHLGARAFEEIGGEVVQTTSFVFRKTNVTAFKGKYFRLLDENSQSAKEHAFLEKKNIFVASQDRFKCIPGSPIAYWISDNILSVYAHSIPLGEIAAPRKGNSTSDNNRFLRLWFEVDKRKMNLHATKIDREESRRKRWYPYNKGGGYRKWYGFNEYLIDWYDDAAAIRKIKTAVIANYQYFTKPGLTWSTVSSKNFSIRWFDEGYIFDNGGCCIFELGDNRCYLIALLNSSVFKYIFGQLNPTLNFQSGEVAKFPVILQKNERIDELAQANVRISKEEYDSFETSWDFLVNPIVDIALSLKIQTHSDVLIEECFDDWKQTCTERFNMMRQNEEEINKIFIDIYGLQNELSPEVKDSDITLRTADYERDIRCLISYSVGCMFGRYSLDKKGIVYAGGDWDSSKYNKYIPDKDNIIPISDDEYFQDDIVSKFIDFVQTVFGENTLEQNLRFIANALPGNGQPRQVIRSYFLNDFYSDHLKMYQKRPIYWMFDSGKRSGFRCLIYMHRYQPDTIARIRTDYVHEQQARYRTELLDLRNRIEKVGSSDKVSLKKRANILEMQDDEIHKYEEKVHHLADQMLPIELDDGVKHNYSIFEDVLAKIK